MEARERTAGAQCNTARTSAKPHAFGRCSPLPGRTVGVSGAYAPAPSCSRLPASSGWAGTPWRAHSAANAAAAGPQGGGLAAAAAAVPG